MYIDYEFKWGLRNVARVIRVIRVIIGAIKVSGTLIRVEEYSSSAKSKFRATSIYAYNTGIRLSSNDNITTSCRAMPAATEISRSECTVKAHTVAAVCWTPAIVWWRTWGKVFNAALNNDGSLWSRTLESSIKLPMIGPRVSKWGDRTLGSSFATF